MTDGCQERYAGALMNTYGPPRLALVRGEGAHVWDEDGKRVRRLLRRHRRQRARPRPPGPGRGRDRPSCAPSGTSPTSSPPRPQVALAERLLGLAGGDGRVFFCQLRHRGQRGRAQADPAHRPHPARRDGGLVPRPHDGRPGAHRARPPTASRSSRCPATSPSCRTATPDALAAAVDDDDRRRDRRADPGRGRRRRPAGRAPARRPGRSPPGTARCSWVDEVQTGIGRTGALVRAHRGRRRPRRRHPRQGPRRRAADRRDCIALRRRGRPCSSPATTAPRSAATRSPAPRRSPCSTRSRTKGCSTPHRRGEQLRRGIAALGRPARHRRARARACCSALSSPSETAAAVVAAGAGARLPAQQHRPGPAAVRAAAHRSPRPTSLRSARRWPGILDGGRPDERHFLARRRPEPRPSRPQVLDLAAQLKAAPYDARPLAGPQHGRDDLRQAHAAHPGHRSPPASPSSAATRCSSTARLAGIGVRESVADVARVLGRQASRHRVAHLRAGRIDEMAAYAGVPVVNALTDDFHPCQLLADLQTVREHKGDARPASGRLRRRRRLQHGQLVAARRRDRRDARAWSARPRATDPAAEMLPAGRRDRRRDRRLGRRRARPAGGGRRRRRRRHRHLGLDGQGGRGRGRGAPVFAPYPVTARADGARRARRDRAALPARLPRQGDRRRGASTARRAWSGTRPRTAGTPRRRSSPGCWRADDELTRRLRPADQERPPPADHRPGHPPGGALPDRARRRCSPARACEVTQATLSRDLVELDAVKVRSAAGALVYAVPGEGGDRRPPRRRRRGRGASGWPGCARSCSSAPTPAPTSSSCAPRRAPRSSWPRRSTRPSCPTSSAPSPATTPSW